LIEVCWNDNKWKILCLSW